MKLLYYLLSYSLVASSQAGSEHLRGPSGITSPSALPPVAEIKVVNKLIAPDGFVRS